MRKNNFVPGEYYHVYSKTMLNIPEFKDFKNANKLVQTFLLSNSTKSGEAFNYLRTSKNPKIANLMNILNNGEKLVDILCYVVMPNHYHLLVKELKEDGIIQFVHRCNTSIAKHINIKKGRKGPLFESRFKSKHIDSNEYLLHLSLYIHLNPLDFLDNKKWRTHKLKDWQSKKEELFKYPWSSIKSFLYDDFNDPVVSGQEIILDQFENREEYSRFLREWSETSLAKIEDTLIK